MSFLNIVLNDSIVNNPKMICQGYISDISGNATNGFNFKDSKGNQIIVNKGKRANDLATLIRLQGVYKGNIGREADGTFYLKNKNGTFFNNGRALNAKTGKMQYYNMHNGRFIQPITNKVVEYPNKSKDNPNTPNGGGVSSGGGGNPHKGSGNPGRPAVHIATYTPGQNTSTQPSWTPDNFEGSYFGNTSQFNTNKDNLDDNSYAVNGIQRGFDGRSSIGIQSNWNRRRDGLRGNQALQQINQKFGQNFTDVKSAQNYINQMLMNSSRITGADMGNISVDGKWGDQSQRALDFVSSVYDKNGNTWDNVSKNNPYADKARTINPNVSIPKPTTPTTSNTALDMFTNDDIRNLGFKNYSGLISAVTNKANANNNFVKAFTARYGNDASKYNQAKIENELGVKGKYRSFGGGDFGDMSRNMASWMGTHNGNLERKNLQDRTGSDGIVYSNKHVRDLFEAHPVKPKTFTFNTNSFGTNIFGTPKKQQGGQLNMNEQELQQAFLQYLMQKTGAQNEQQLEQVVQQLGEDGLKQAYAQFMQEMQQQQIRAAKFGAKLNYIRKLNGQCPEGMEMYYYKQGGRLCRKCMQVKQNEEETEYPSNPIDAFKCGRKIKKKKCEIGGTVDMYKCGAKMKKKKCEDGGTVNIDKCGAKIKKKKCENGGLIPFDKCGKKMKKK